MRIALTTTKVVKRVVVPIYQPGRIAPRRNLMRKTNNLNIPGAYPGERRKP